MAAPAMLLFTVLVSLVLSAQSFFNHTAFPSDFVFGAASSAYQYEGAAFEGGKGKSIWDTFAHTFPGKIMNGENGDVALDFYHRYKEDVHLMKSYGLDAFRFSISWPRVLPKGKLTGGINKEGVAFYNNLINELLSKGIQPYVTLFHWDLPQALQDEYGGFLHPRIMKDYTDYAELCFKLFGDRVKHWITFNEPYIFITQGYESGALAPGRCSAWMNNNCPAGNTSTEPYIVSHHMILAHAHAVKVYKQKYQASQKGVIGITQVATWFLPYSDSHPDIRSVNRSLDFTLGWYTDPIVFGHYPHSMRTMVPHRLPTFSAEEVALIKGSYDFIGLNYYTTMYAYHVKPPNTNNHSPTTDSHVAFNYTNINGHLIGAPTGVEFFHVYPQGLRDLLIYMKHKYHDPTIYITENGLSELNVKVVSQGINDTSRVSFYYEHIKALKNALDHGVKVKGFFPWTLLDTFEWGSGYALRFGITFIDYTNNLKRYPKHSALWFKKFLSTRRVLEDTSIYD